MAKTVITNVTAVTMDPPGKSIDDAYILIEDGKVNAVGARKEADGKIFEAEGLNYIDGEGCQAYPGFIDAHCHLGMFDDHIGKQGSDGNEITDPVTPQLRAVDAFFHDDPTVPEALEGGVTTVMTGPGSANVIGGQFALLKPYGRTVDEMTILAPAAMKAALGENPKGCYGDKGKAPQTRMANAALLRSALQKAARYREAAAKAEEEGRDKPSYDPVSEALLPVLERKLILKIHCHRADDILTAVRIANEFSLRYTLDHCTEGYLIADVLEEEYAAGGEEGHGTMEGIICGPLITDRSKPELSRKWNGLAAVLYDTGIPLAIATDHPVIPIQYAGIQAALLMRDGLSREAALECLTVNPARILGMGDRLGSISPGKDADIVLWNDDPFACHSTVNRVLINGQTVYEE